MRVCALGRVVLAACVLWGAAVRANVKLPAVIGDNMVLQQGQPIKVWGTADPGEKVSVTLGRLTGEATADQGGKWLVKLGPLPGSAEAIEMTVAGKNSVTVKNILVGEVWLCSGQSNMEFGTGGAINSNEEIAKADLPTIRLFNISPNKVSTEQPMEDVKARWQVCSPTSVPKFSAVGFFFGRELNEKLKVPVGLINASWGGSPVEQWIPPQTYQTDEDLAGLRELMAQHLANLPKAREDYPKQLETWAATTREMAATRPALAQQKNGLPRRPGLPGVRYGGMYNGNIAPVVNYAIKGVIWYQGEQNAGNWMGYRTSFPAMIRGWRQVWGEGDFPFLFVQLANFMAPTDDPNRPTDWAGLREAQTMTLALPNTAMAVIIDVGEAKDIHPKDKQTVGHRLALPALAKFYGMTDMPSSSPMFEAMKVEGNKIRVSFRHAEGGLTARGEGVTGFAIAAADGKYVWADASIDGPSVVVSTEKVANPVMVRYAWADNPVCNVYSKAGLPVCPFRAGEPDVTAAPAPVKR